MSVLLTHIGEEITRKLLEATPDEFLREKLGARPTNFFRELPLRKYKGKAFDGMGKVDVVLQISDSEAIPVEVKLGTSRMNKGRIEGWVTKPKPSHNNTRWGGNMIGVLGQFEGLTVTTPEGASLRLTPNWFLVLRHQVYVKWCERGLLDMLKKGRIIVFEELLQQVGKERFNEIVQKLLPDDPYTTWKLDNSF